MFEEPELTSALADAGIDVENARSLPVRRDGSEVRGGLPETVDLVKNLLVFLTNEVDLEQAKAVVRAVFAVLDLRRERGEDDEVYFVSIYGAEGKRCWSACLSRGARAARPRAPRRLQT